MSWESLAKSLAWQPWHDVNTALRWFLAGGDLEGLTSVLEKFSATHVNPPLNRPVAAAVCLATAATGTNGNLRQRASRFLDRQSQAAMRSKARAFLAAIHADASPERLFWLSAVFTRRAALPRPLRRKSVEILAPVAASLRMGIRQRDADSIVRAIATLVDGFGENGRKLSQDSFNLWASFWRHVEFEALNGLFAWPLFYDLQRPNQAMALPISIEALPNGRRVLIIPGERLSPSPVASEGSGPGGAEFSRVARQSADIARSLVLTHSRHLSEASRVWISEASFTIDLRPADYILGLADIRPSISDRSLSALLATCFAARLMRRPMPLVAMSGNIIGTPYDRVVGPRVEQVQKIGLKLAHAKSTEIFEMAVRSADPVLEGGEAGAEPTAAHALPVLPLPVRPVITLADAFDVCFTGLWRRSRRERLPASASREPVPEAAIVEFLRNAGPVAHLPAELRIEDLLAYFQRANRANSRGASPPPGIASVFASIVPEDRGAAGLAKLDRICGFPLSTKPDSYPSDTKDAAAWIDQRLRSEFTQPLVKAPDIVVLTAPEIEEAGMAGPHLIDTLAAVTPAPDRDPRWRERIGDVRIVIAPAPTLAERDVSCLGETERAALRVLGLFRLPFADGQALVALSAAGIANAKDCFRALQKSEWVIPSLTPRLWQCAARVDGDLDPHRAGLVHWKIAQTFSSHLIATPLLGWSGLSEDPLSVTEAIYHLERACSLLRQCGLDAEMTDCAQALALLLSIHSVTPDLLPVAVAHCPSSEPFILMAREHWDAGWRPEGRVALALATLIANRSQEFSSRRPLLVGIGDDEHALRSLVSDLIDYLCDGPLDIATAAGAASTLLNGVPADRAMRIRLEAVLDHAIMGDDDFALVHIQANLLCRMIGHVSQAAERYSEYLRCWRAGHQAHAGLLLGAIGTAPGLVDVEELWTEADEQLSQSGKRWIASLKWRDGPDSCQRDFQKGYGRLSDLALLDEPDC